MKVRITLKDPDGIYECIRDAVEESRPAGLDQDEWVPVRNERIRALSHSTFIEYGDYITVEIDTDANTARVLTVKEANA